MGRSDARRTRFKAGRFGGCEAELFEFRNEDREEPNYLRIAAINFEDAVAYLRRHEPEFKVRSVQSLGLILLASGSPVD